MRELLFECRQIQRKIFVGFAFLLLPALLWAQVRTVTGTVTDETGKPLSGVSVLVKSATAGTSTNEAGKFTITASQGDVLVFSSVNFEPQEQTVGTQTDLAVSLKSKAGTMSDVVVVGYATQRKVNMTGSVSTISGKTLDNRPVTNVSSALSGLASGVYVRQGSGRPGSDGGTIRIRGIASPNNSDALVVIDGIIGVLDAVNPADIESISILKDASAASIYGAQASNGVILITTKKGSRGKPTVTYNGIFSQTRPVKLPTFVSDYVTHMEYYNEAAFNSNVAPVYSQSTIDLWKEKNQRPNERNQYGIPNFVAYPNTNWGEEVFNYGVLQNHNISVAGGSPNTRYLFSGRYLHNPGIIYNTGLKRYELRMNLETNITDFLTVGTQTFGLRQHNDVGNTDNLFNFLRQTTPGIYPLYGGKFGGPSAPDEAPILNNLFVYLYGNKGAELLNRFNTTVFGKVKFLRDFEFETRFNYQLRMDESNYYSNPIDRWNFTDNTIVFPAATVSTLGISAGYSKNYTSTFDNVLRWGRSFGKSDVRVLVGHNEWYYNENGFGASQQGVIDPTIYTIGTGTQMQSITGYRSDRAMRSFFGRVNYGFGNKYLFEANLRYDASSKFGPENQWATFPSFSVGWRLSEEEIFSGLNTTFQNLKLRASWGRLGNERSLGNYDWQSNYGSVNYSFGGSQVVGLREGRMGNSLLKWEESENISVALEGNAFRNKASFEVEYFKRNTNDLLTRLSLPVTLGTITAPFVNGPSFENKGVELTLGWRDRPGAFQYNLSGNFTYIGNKVSKWKGKLKEGWQKDGSGNDVWLTNLNDVANSSGTNGIILESYAYQEYLVRKVYRGTGQYFNPDGSVNINGGPTTGMIRTPEDLAWINAMKAAGYAFSPVNNVFNPAQANTKVNLGYGDLIYADLNGDKTYGNANDRYFTGTSPNPKFLFGLNAGFSWKNLDFSMIWFGAAGFEYYWNAEGYNSSLLRNGNGVSTYAAENRYYYNAANPADPRTNLHGKLPRLRLNTDNINYVASDYWLVDGSYLKLRNVQLGYTLPEAWIRKIKGTTARIYVSAENVLTFSAFEGLDPEMGAGIGYPIMRQYAAGVTIGF